MPTDPSPKPAFQLKNIYSKSLLQGFSQKVQESWDQFPIESFLDTVFDEHWEKLELKERMRHISDGLRNNLPPSYDDALKVLVEVTQGLIAESGEKMVFEYGFIPDFVERFGLEYPNVSIPALEQVTRWTSAEFAVRPYLKNYPEQMYAQMQDWSKHSSAMVRRLSSEGFRPRLPWGMGIPALKKDPTVILPVLENLKNDPAETVRRSVANNLNDISKDHPDLALQLAEKWLGNTPETDWVVRHACRGLLKKGHPTALKLFGFDPDLNTIEIKSFQHDPEVAVGQNFHFNFHFVNTASKASMIRLEYAIDYQTLSGKISHKVFKISEFEMAGGEQKEFAKKQSFRNFTTRKHYPGTHRLSIIVNGKDRISSTFEVVA